MNCISFQNPGEIDLRAVSLFGANAKPNSANPIGYFGTGLKYACAILLRTNHKLEIWVGATRHELTVKNDKFRDKDLQIIYLDNQPLSYSTELGKDWPLWAVLRELECNAKDEGGFSTRQELAPRAGHTTIRVYGGAFYNEYEKMGEIFLPKTAKPLYRSEAVEIYPGKSSQVYYRGVKVHTLEKPSIYTYNILDRLELTEDRTLKYGFYAAHKATWAIVGSDESRVINAAIVAPKDYWENCLDFNIGIPSTEFLACVKDQIKSKNIRLSPSARKAYLDNTKESISWDALILTPQQQSTLNWAKGILRKLQFDPDRYDIIVCESLGEEVIGHADRTNNQIRLALRCFQIGHRMVASTLLEEYIHLAQNLDDMTRGMQNYLFDMLLSLLDDQHPPVDRPTERPVAKIDDEILF